MTPKNDSIPRRRALTVIAGVGAGLLVPGVAIGASSRRFEWRGSALGTEASII